MWAMSRRQLTQEAEQRLVFLSSKFLFIVNFINCFCCTALLQRIQSACLLTDAGFVKLCTAVKHHKMYTRTSKHYVYYVLQNLYHNIMYCAFNKDVQLIYTRLCVFCIFWTSYSGWLDKRTLECKTCSSAGLIWEMALLQKWKSRLIELKTKTEHNNIVKCTSEITETVRDLPEKNTKNTRNCLMQTNFPIWYSARRYFNMCSKADISQLNLLHGTKK